MKKYTVYIPGPLQAFLRHLHPDLKAKIRMALKELETDPYLGKPLKEQLTGLHSYRVTGYRIVYRINRQEIWIEIIEIAQRKIVYQYVLKLISDLKVKK